MNISTQFLKRTFADYLLPDVQSLLTVQADASNRGACLYPLAMTLASGTELAGALISSGRYNHGDGKQYFQTYWMRLYGAGSKDEAVEVYRAVRHPLAHVFLPKLWVARHEATTRFIVDEHGDLNLNLRAWAADFEKKCRADFLDCETLPAAVEAMALDIQGKHRPFGLVVPTDPPPQVRFGPIDIRSVAPGS